MPSRHHPRGRGQHSYAPIAAEAEDTSVIYAQVDKGKKRRRGRDLNIFNTSSSSSSVRDAADCDAISGTVHEVHNTHCLLIDEFKLDIVVVAKKINRTRQKQHIVCQE